MKKQPILTESEKYFLAKNKRRQWWSDNGYKFLMYPVMGTIITAAVVILFLGLSSAIVHSVWKAEPQTFRRIVEEYTPWSSVTCLNDHRINDLQRRISQLEESKSNALGSSRLYIHPDDQIWLTNAVEWYTNTVTK